MFSFIRRIAATLSSGAQKTFEDDYGLTKPPVLAESFPSTTPDPSPTSSQPTETSSVSTPASEDAVSGSSSTPTTPFPSSIAYPTADDWALILRQRYGIAQAFVDEEEIFF